MPDFTYYVSETQKCSTNATHYRYIHTLYCSAFVDDAYLDYNSFEPRFKFHCSVQDNMRPVQSETLDIF